MDNHRHTTKNFDQALAEGKLIGTECQNCGRKVSPQRLFCPDCGSSNTKLIEFSGEGKIAAFTVIYVPATQMANLGYGPKNPYCSAIVELEEGPRISAQVTGLNLQNPQDIKIGQPVKMEIITVGEGEETQTVLTFRKV